jgi:hypothetical protein
VPAAIKDQFDVARNAFSYSWFVYDFSMLAEQQCYFVLEMALRQRVPHDQKAKPGKSSGMNKLLKAARTQKILLEEDFMAPPMPGGGKPMCRLELLPTSRNNLAHGNINLLPQYVLMIMELTAQVLNALFAPKNE